ncbi:hypothetical protein [Schaalia georgiae]|uniref:hypothetical protein n=1 Tax=Schaalia georgiae TaxID=52768 RepID=UPI001FB0B1B2|nr:hypothetical protein [Schaalia georgiae]
MTSALTTARTALTASANPKNTFGLVRTALKDPSKRSDMVRGRRAIMPGRGGGAHAGP